MDADPKMKKAVGEKLMRFSEDRNGCREWTGICVGAYGLMVIRGKGTTAHRWAYRHGMNITSLERNVQVRHLCGNSKCVKFEHLTTGTPTENAADKIAHGTSPHGEGHGCASITNDTARLIKNSKGQGTQKERAMRFNTTISIIGAIDRGNAWAWLGATADKDDKTIKPKQSKGTKKHPRDYTDDDFDNAKKFVNKKLKTQDDGCGAWTLKRNAQGYGRTGFLGYGFLAHKLSFIAHTRMPIPDKKIVRHKCKNKACCSIDHLELGSAKENAQDRVRDGTDPSRKGEAHPRSTITVDTARLIRDSKGNGTAKDRAQRFNCTITVVHNIDYNGSWASSM